MAKINIEVFLLGDIAKDFNKGAVVKWKSDLFTIHKTIEQYELRVECDLGYWAYSDDLLYYQFPQKDKDTDIQIGIIQGQIEDNYYSRRLDDNRIIISFYQTKEILEQANIPLHNLVIYLIYTYALIYKAYQNIPTYENLKMIHHETKGCLYDMHGIKSDVVHSCHNPILCDQCKVLLGKEGVSSETLNLTKKEITNIKKPLYFRILDTIKKHPIWALFISSIFAISLGIIGSLTASWIWEIMHPTKIEKSISVNLSH